jgi:endonuclease/exonuclease/phosphatase family metal-dependent hydrolase
MRRVPAAWIGLGLLCALGCSQAPAPAGREPEGAESMTPAPQALAASSLALMTWNVEWFQDPAEGPSDDALQFARVLEVLRRTDADLIALQEVASAAAFEQLVAALPGHSGVLSDYAWTQKLGLLYAESRLSVRSVSALEGLADAGRPPLDVRLELQPEGTALRVVVLHAKARDDAESYATRVRFAAELARRLAPEHELTLVLGDFNDGLAHALSADRAAPYAPLLAIGLAPLSGPLEAETGAERSSWPGTLDHILASEPLAARLVPGSVDVLQRELLAVYPDFVRTVSDHFPVVATLGAEPP